MGNFSNKYRNVVQNSKLFCSRALVFDRFQVWLYEPHTWNEQLSVPWHCTSCQVLPSGLQRKAHARPYMCCDRMSRAACAQSFAPWQQATTEIMLAISLTIACSRYIYYGVILHAHPVRGESHNQRNTTGEVATNALLPSGQRKAWYTKPCKRSSILIIRGKRTAVPNCPLSVLTRHLPLMHILPHSLPRPVRRPGRWAICEQAAPSVMRAACRTKKRRPRALQFSWHGPPEKCHRFLKCSAKDFNPAPQTQPKI